MICTATRTFYFTSPSMITSITFVKPYSFFLYPKTYLYIHFTKVVYLEGLKKVEEASKKYKKKSKRGSLL